MKNYKLFQCLLLAIMLSGIVTAQPTASSIASDKIFIKLKPGYENLQQASFNRNSKGRFQTGIRSIDSLPANLPVKNLHQSFEKVFTKKATAQQQTLQRWYTVELTDDANISEAIARFKNMEAVEQAEPAFIRYLHDWDAPTQQWIPADSAYNQQWHYNQNNQQGATSPAGTDADIDLPEAWEIEKGKPSVIVAVLDGGVDTSHPDLRANLWVGSNGERFGYNWNTYSTQLNANVHGTHVCGTVAAVNNNTIGISGVAGGDGTVSSGARIMSMQIFNNSGTYAGDDATANAFVYAADHGAAIAQCSWGGGDYSQIVADAIDYFIMYGGGTVMNGGTVIFSAGNDGREEATFPSYYAPVICVSATNYNAVKSSYSQYGSWVDINAPGGETAGNSQKGILSTWPVSSGSYGWQQGTSMAAPHVSGVAALCISKAQGKISNQQLRQLLLSTVKDVYTLNPTYTGKLGTGRLNAYNALQSANALTSRTIDSARQFTASLQCGTATLNWQKNTSNNDVIIAVADTLLFGEPSGTLQPGDTLLAGGKIVYKGNANSFQYAIPLSQRKYFRIWSVNGSNYSFHKTLVAYNPAPSGILIATSGSGCNIQLSWNDQLSCLTDSIIIIVNKSNTASSLSGVLYVGDKLSSGATVIYKGRASNYTYNTTLDSTHYFQKWVFNAAHQYYTPAVDNFISIEKTNAIQSIQPVAGSSSIALSWKANSSSCFSGITYLLAQSNTCVFGNPTGTYQAGNIITGGGTVLYIGTDSSFTHNGLTANTSYCYRLWKINAAGDYSFGKQTCITTNCSSNIISLPFAEGFNGDANTVPAVCTWDITDNTTIDNPLLQVRSQTNPTASAIEGTGMLIFKSYQITGGSTARLSSKAIKKGTDTAMDIRFRWYQDSSSYTSATYAREGVTVQWSRDRSSWQTLEFYPRVPVQSHTGWAYKQISLPAAATAADTVYISFLFTSGYGNNCYMDNLQLQTAAYKPADNLISQVACESTDSTNLWTNYYDSTGNRLLSIYKNNNNIGKAGQSGFSLFVNGSIGATQIPPTATNYVSNPGGWITMNRYYNIQPIAQANSNMQVMFYFTDADIDALKNAAASLTPSRNTATIKDFYGWVINPLSGSYNTNPQSGHSNIPAAIAYNGNGLAQYLQSVNSDTSHWKYNAIGNGINTMEYTARYATSGGLGIGSIYGKGAFKANTIYTFTGNGSWQTTANWENNLIPPTTLPADAIIIINPTTNGQCILDRTQQIANGGSIIVKEGRSLVVNGNLEIIY